MQAKDERIRLKDEQNVSNYNQSISKFEPICFKNNPPSKQDETNTESERNTNSQFERVSVNSLRILTEEGAKTLIRNAKVKAKKGTERIRQEKAKKERNNRQTKDANCTDASSNKAHRSPITGHLYRRFTWSFDDDESL